MRKHVSKHIPLNVRAKINFTFFFDRTNAASSGVAELLEPQQQCCTAAAVAAAASTLDTTIR